MHQFLPPHSEQRAIAAFLDRETAKIDALVAKKERLIELLQEKRTALISDAVTKGLDPDVPLKDSGVEWLGEIPAHWEVKRLKTLVNKIGKQVPSGGRTLWRRHHGAPKEISGLWRKRCADGLHFVRQMMNVQSSRLLKMRCLVTGAALNVCHWQKLGKHNRARCIIVLKPKCRRSYWR